MWSLDGPTNVNLRKLSKTKKVSSCARYHGLYGVASTSMPTLIEVETDIDSSATSDCHPLTIHTRQKLWSFSPSGYLIYNQTPLATTSNLSLSSLVLNDLTCWDSVIAGHDHIHARVLRLSISPKLGVKGKRIERC